MKLINGDRCSGKTTTLISMLMKIMHLYYVIRVEI